MEGLRLIYGQNSIRCIKIKRFSSMNGILFYKKRTPVWLSKLLLGVNWKLLLFLLLFLNVKLYVKVFAIVLMYLWRFNVKFGFRLRGSRLPFFYISVILIALANLVVHSLYRNIHYDILWMTGIFFWLLCILAGHQVKLSVDTTEPGVLQNTLILFFAINAVVSFANILGIMIETGQYNPYLYQGQFQKYFIGTGDYIKGIFWDTSTTNAIINAFGVVYFLYRKEVIMTLLCMIVMLLTGSNLTNLLLTVALTGIFIFRSTRDQKSIIAICIFLMILFLAKVSPQNNSYTFETFKNTFSFKGSSFKKNGEHGMLTEAEEKKQRIARSYLDSLKATLTPKIPEQISLADRQLQQEKTTPTRPFIKVVEIPGRNKATISKLTPIMDSAPVKKIIEPVSHATTVFSPLADSWIRPSIPQPDINSFEYQSSADTTALQRRLIAFAQKERYTSPVSLTTQKEQSLPGKIVAMEQTIYLLRHNPSMWITGSGMGNFSSKLAFRATGLNIAGGYPEKYTYVSKEFGSNHLALFIYYFTRRSGFHSVINTPDSVIDQLFAEYGIAGILSFLFFYVWYFVRHIKRLSFGIPLMFIMAGVFMLGYWFEQLSVVVLFELLLLTDIKSCGEAALPKQENT